MLIKIMLPVIALLAVGTGCANKHYANAVEQYNNEESLDDTNRALYENCTNLNIEAACNNLGYSYGTTQGIKQDYSKATKYKKKACNMNYGLGCFNLGLSYAKGQDERQNYKKANTYYEKACNLNIGARC